MSAATNAQVQTYVDTYIRPFCESARSVFNAAQNIRDSISDVYSNLSSSGTTWTDQRVDNPPHLMSASDVLAINTIVVDMLNYKSGEGQWPILLESCVRPDS